MSEHAKMTAALGSIALLVVCVTSALDAEVGAFLAFLAFIGFVSAITLLVVLEGVR